jgi:hypothetical protein
MSYFDYEKTLMSQLDNLRMQMLARPLNLGGVAGEGGGGGGGLGYVGYLPQTRVSYDESELASELTVASGRSLLDNLNHIRYRLEQVEGNSSGSVTVKENGVVVSSGITVLDFIGSEVGIISASEVTISSVGGSTGGGHTIEDETTPLAQRSNLSFQGAAISVSDDAVNDRTVVSVTAGEYSFIETLSNQCDGITDHFDVSNAIPSGTLRVYWNGLRQEPGSVTIDVDDLGFTMPIIPESSDTLVVDYAFADIGGSGSITPHTHPTSDIVSGTFNPARLGTGTRDGTKYLRDDGTWQFVSNASVVSQALFTAGGATGVLATGVDPYKVYNVTGQTKTIIKVFLAVDTAPAGAAIIVDVLKGGVTIFTNQAHRPTIADGATTGQTTTIDISSWADSEYLTISISQVGESVPGSYLTVHVVYS